MLLFEISQNDLGVNRQWCYFDSYYRVVLLGNRIFCGVLSKYKCKFYNSGLLWLQTRQYRQRNPVIHYWLRYNKAKESQCCANYYRISTLTCRYMYTHTYIYIYMTKYMRFTTINDIKPNTTKIVWERNRFPYTMEPLYKGHPLWWPSKRGGLSWGVKWTWFVKKIVYGNGPNFATVKHPWPFQRGWEGDREGYRENHRHLRRNMPNKHAITVLDLKGGSGKLRL